MNKKLNLNNFSELKRKSLLYGKIKKFEKKNLNELNYFSNDLNDIMESEYDSPLVEITNFINKHDTIKFEKKSLTNKKHDDKTNENIPNHFVILNKGQIHISSILDENERKMNLLELNSSSAKVIRSRDDYAYSLSCPGKVVHYYKNKSPNKKIEKNNNYKTLQKKSNYFHYVKDASLFKKIDNYITNKNKDKVKIPN